MLTFELQRDQVQLEFPALRLEEAERLCWRESERGGKGERRGGRRAKRREERKKGGREGLRIMNHTSPDRTSADNWAQRRHTQKEPFPLRQALSRVTTSNTVYS